MYLVIFLHKLKNNVLRKKKTKRCYTYEQLTSAYVLHKSKFTVNCFWLASTEHLDSEVDELKQRASTISGICRMGSLGVLTPTEHKYN